MMGQTLQITEFDVAIGTFYYIQNGHPYDIEILLLKYGASANADRSSHAVSNELLIVLLIQYA
jgi:hypothetical protein